MKNPRKIFYSLYSEFKFVIERKFTSFLLWLLTIISMFLVIKTSNGQNGFPCEISIGFLVSVIFYLVVVYIPENRKKKDIEPLIKNKCETLILSSFGLIHEIIRISKLEYNYKTLTKDQFKEVCKIVNPKEYKYEFHTNIVNITQHHLGYKIFNDWLRVVKEIEEILKLLPYVDSGLLKRIYNLYNNPLRYNVNILATYERFKNTNLESQSDTLYGFYFASKNLRDYYKMYSKKDFNNDPWK